MDLSRFVLLITSIFLCSLYTVADVEIFFAPNGGFAKINNERKITLNDGQEVAPTLNNALLDLIQRSSKGGQIKIAMYAVSYKPTEQALIDAATRGVKVKIILDAAASWTVEIRNSFKKMIAEAQALAKKEKRAFDFQLKEIYPKIMKARERTRILRDGKVIFGTMHEKFGIFYSNGNKVPVDAFCGSANVSWGAGHIFAENRIIFRNEPHVGLQLAEEFARLWNEYGTDVTGNCESERLLPVDGRSGEIRIVSNSKPVDVEHYQRIDETLNNILKTVNSDGGTIDVAMFSFTHYNLANMLLFLAQRNPKIKVRVLLDQTQIEDDENHLGVMGPFMEKRARFRKLTNFEVRYKWRSNAFGWDEESKSAQLLHFRNLLLHHKCVVVDRKLMALGSYNWSESAEVRNFENIMIFKGFTPKNQDVIDRFMAEFDYIWNSLRTKDPVTETLANPQVIEGYRGRILKEKIVKAYGNFICRRIMDTIFKKEASFEKLLEVTKLEKEALENMLKWLQDVTLIFEKEKEGKKVYALVD